MRSFVQRVSLFFTVLSAVVLLTGCRTSAPAEKPKPPAAPKLNTALYVDRGCAGSGVARWALLLQNSPDVELRLIDGKDLIGNDLKGLDLIVMPGGSSYQQWESMEGMKGGKNLQDFVRNGGKYFGTCAGMSLILNEPKRVPMIPFACTPGKAPGRMIARVSLTKEGAKALKLPSSVMLRYSIGPIVKQGAPMDDVSCKVLGHFNCELSQRGMVKRPMYHTPAIIFADCAKGKIFVTNCHPENLTATHPVLIGGLRLLTGKTVKFVYPQKAPGAVRVAFHCTAIGGKPQIRDLFALDSRPGVDVVPVADEDIRSGVLEHMDFLFVTRSEFPDDAKLFSAGAAGKQIKAFAERGGRIVRSVDEIK